MKSFFLRPGNNNHAIEKIEELLRKGNDVAISIAYFNSQRLGDLIAERKNQNKATRILINTADILRPREIGDTSIAISGTLLDLLMHANEFGPLQIKSLGLRATGKYQNMHHKFIISDNHLIIGSVNFTDAALNRNYESFIYTTAPQLNREFRLEFEELWRLASDIHVSNDGKIRSLMCPICERNEGIDFESYGMQCTYCGHSFRVF